MTNPKGAGRFGYRSGFGKQFSLNRWALRVRKLMW